MVTVTPPFLLIAMTCSKMLGPMHILARIWEWMSGGCTNEYGATTEDGWCTEDRVQRTQWTHRTHALNYTKRYKGGQIFLAQQEDEMIDYAKDLRKIAPISQSFSSHLSMSVV